MLFSLTQNRHLSSYLDPRFAKRNDALKRVVEISGYPFCPKNVEALMKALDLLVVAHVAATLELARSPEEL